MIMIGARPVVTEGFSFLSRLKVDQQPGQAGWRGGGAKADLGGSGRRSDRTLGAPELGLKGGVGDVEDDGGDFRSLRDPALGADADGLKYIDFMKGKKFDSPRGPVEIDPVERDIIQNVYIRQVEKRDGRLVNVDVDEVKMVKDPWKIDHPATSN